MESLQLEKVWHVIVSSLFTLPTPRPDILPLISIYLTAATGISIHPSFLEAREITSTPRIRVLLGKVRNVIPGI